MATMPSSGASDRRSHSPYHGPHTGQFFAQDIAEPLNADFHIGTPERLFDRIATLSPPGAEGLPAELDEDSVAARAFRNPAPVAEAAMTKGWRTAEIPAANGHGNAGVSYAPKPPLRMVAKRSVSNCCHPRCRRALSCRSKAMTWYWAFPVGSAWVMAELARFPVGPNPNTGFWGGKEAQPSW